MNRRNPLTSTISATAGAALLATDPDAVWANGTKSVDAKNKLVSMPFLETRDRATLFYKDWGTGKPVVFVHSWFESLGSSASRHPSSMMDREV